ncbi:serine acetyltransferase [Hanstruepera flava]|uniref:serine acetyltransferase n=1 Tax=Hanstruepera flava TaxID=2930218 RepID=UPI0020280F62|nr:serine acetyltransferase [Hanstruepera flava]
MKHLLRRLLLRIWYRRYVLHDVSIQDDIVATLEVRGSKVQKESLEKQFNHLMLHYPDYALLFFWRINKSKNQWRGLFLDDIPFKIFRSTEIGGGMMCYHPFSTVINAKSIGKNFQFRNGLTIGNKGNDNAQLPTLGDFVTVGAQVVIIGNITIGDHVLIGAGSVVVKDVPSHCVVAGNPAKIIKRLNG